MPILIVDDDPTIRDLVTLMLTQAGFDQVICAESAMKAFEVLGIEPTKKSTIMPDVIVLDIMMPEIDGIEACARIKRDERFFDVPILMATTLGDIEHLQKAFLAGASDYMTKPLRIEELLARVRSAHRLKKELDRRKLRELELKARLPEIPQKMVSVVQASGLFGEDVLLEKLGWQLQKNDGALIILGVDAWDAYLGRYPKEQVEKMIADIAMVLSHQTASLGDLLVELGNGKFGILCPHADGLTVQKNAELWKNAITALKIPHAFSPAGPLVTMSAGIVFINGWTGSRADLLAKAMTEFNRVGV